MSINKEKSMNYILSAIVLCIAIFIINKLAFKFWRFDIFNLKHYSYFAKYVISGRILKSPKYLAFLSVIIGSILITYIFIIESLQFDFKKYFAKEDKKQDVPVKEEVKEVVKEEENTPVKNIEDERITRYNIYNNPERISEADIVRETPQPKHIIEEEPAPSNAIDEEKEREKLQSKIKEVMERLKNKNSDEEEKTEKRILTPAQFDTVKKESDMNFKNITSEQNEIMEGILVGAGFKLLSEIRIGKTGIDYLGVSKSGISIIQLDTTNGNWMASEDDVGNIMPVWFSEDKQKISPVARAIEARNIVSDLIKGKVDLPVKSYVCLANSGIMNYFDISDKWDEDGIEVLKLPSNSSFEDIDNINEKFTPSSEEEIDEETMNKLIEILEKAELPE
ncbi:hypothetical protein HDR59_03375 [bacterium]|nr:hypothetical protein [bacterium]